MAEVLSPMG